MSNSPYDVIFGDGGSGGGGSLGLNANMNSTATALQMQMERERMRYGVSMAEVGQESQLVQRQMAKAMRDAMHNGSATIYPTTAKPKYPPAKYDVELTVRVVANGLIVKVGPHLWIADESDIEAVLMAAISTNLLEK